MIDKNYKINLETKDSFEKLEMIEELEKTNSFTTEDYKFLNYLSDDEDYEVRAKVAEVLVEYIDSEAEKILIKLLGDKDELVRVNACDSLCNSNSSEVINQLKYRILKDRSNLVRGYAVLSLVDIITRLNYDLSGNMNFLRSMLDIQKVKWVKLNIYKALYLLGDETYLDILISELNDRYYRNRCAVVNILSELISNQNCDKIMKALIERKRKENSIAVISTIDEIVNDNNRDTI